MIFPIRWLWEQLNGPQIRGIATGIYEYIRLGLDAKLDYFNSLSLTSAKSDHLNLMGTLMGVARPTIHVQDSKFFFFTESAQSGVTHGFSANDDTAAVGGKFGDTDIVEATEGGIPIPTEYYRAILIAMANSKGAVGSVALMDDIITALWKKDNPSKTPIHTFTILEAVDGNRTLGDIVVDLGLMDDWFDWSIIVAILQAIGETLFAPEPRWFFTIKEPEIDVPPNAAQDANGAYLLDANGNFLEVK